jgi:DNA-binding MarR family transcriptional regulator
MSASGVEIYERIAPVLLQYEAELLAGLSATDRRHLDRILARLVSRARQVGSPAPG